MMIARRNIYLGSYNSKKNNNGNDNDNDSNINQEINRIMKVSNIFKRNK